MAWYKLYAGMAGGFGGARYIGTEEFDCESDANEAAYEEAIGMYQSYEGMNGIRSWDCVAEEFVEEKNADNPEYLADKEREEFDYSKWLSVEDEEVIGEIYSGEVDGWICYYVEEAEGEDDVED